MAELVRRGGGVFEQADITKKKQIKDTDGLAPTISSLDQAGFEPKQSEQALKAKKPIIEKALDKEQTLAGAMRLQEFDTELQAQEQKQRLEQLQKLGQIGVSIQNKVRAQFANLQPTTARAEVDEEAIRSLGGDPETLQTPLNNLISSLEVSAQDFDEGERATLTQLWQASNPGGVPTEEDLKKTKQSQQVQKTLQQLSDQDVSYEEALKMINMSAEQVGISAQDIIPASDLTMGIVFSDEDLAAISAAGMDPEQMKGMTIDEFQQEIEDLRQQEFSNMRNVRAQLAATPPGSAQYRLLVDQMRAMGMVGQTGIQADMAELADQIAAADVLQVGDQAMTVEQILSDNNISSVVEEYLALDPDDPLDAERINELKQVYSEEFVGWIDSQQEALKDLADEAKLEVEKYGDAQTQWKNLSRFGKTEFEPRQLEAMGIEGWDPEMPVTAANVLEYKQKIESSPIYQVFSQEFDEAEMKKFGIKNESDLEQVQNTMRGLLDPTTIKKVKHLTAEELMQRHQDYEEAKTSPLVQKILGEVEPFSVNVDEPWKVNKLVHMSKMVSGVNPDWLIDPDYIMLAEADLERGNLDGTETLVNNPGLMGNLKTFKANKQQAQDLAPTMESVMDELINPDQIGDSVGWQQQYEDLKTRASYSKAAEDQLERFVGAYDANQDGVVDEDDAPLLKDRILSGWDTDPLDVLTGQANHTSTLNTDAYQQQPTAEFDSDEDQALHQFLNEDPTSPGVLDETELTRYAQDLNNQRSLVKLYENTGKDVGPLYDHIARTEKEKFLESPVGQNMEHISNLVRDPTQAQAIPTDELQRYVTQDLPQAIAHFEKLESEQDSRESHVYRESIETYQYFYNLLHGTLAAREKTRIEQEGATAGTGDYSTAVPHAQQAMGQDDMTFSADGGPGINVGNFNTAIPAAQQVTQQQEATAPAPAPTPAPTPVKRPVDYEKFHS